MIDPGKDNLTKIAIPEKLIPLLKEYTKMVIRQQPKDLLSWSEQYFRRLAAAENEVRVELRGN